MGLRKDFRRFFWLQRRLRGNKRSRLEMFWRHSYLVTT